MIDHDYRTLPRIANSDLSALASHVLGKSAMKASAETLAFGASFHTLILEPHRFNPSQVGVPSDILHPLLNMKHALESNADVWQLIQNSEREVVRLWECPTTGLPLKARLDIVVMPRRRHLIDLKTTSARTQYDFVRSITEYHYDRQAAFYLSSDPEAEYFEFIGVGKQPPYFVFRHAMHRDSIGMERGFTKMNVLLKRVKTEFDNPQGWVPASWSRKEEQV